MAMGTGAKAAVAADVRRRGPGETSVRSLPARATPHVVGHSSLTGDQTPTARLK